MPDAKRVVKKSDIVFLAGDSPLYAVIANALQDEFGTLAIVREQGEPKSVLFKRRIKRLGYWAVAGQFAFALFSRVILYRSQERLASIIKNAGASLEYPAQRKIFEVDSVNSDNCREILKMLGPKVVVVVGTRIIHQPTLECIAAPFINYHPGLTPKYRGLHGCYWTLASDDVENLAITVHLIDENVDTGDPLYQEKVSVPPGNNIITYPFTMAVAARSVVTKAVDDALKGKLKPFKAEGLSKQWFHPTLWGYLWVGLRRGVW